MRWPWCFFFGGGEVFFVFVFWRGEFFFFFAGVGGRGGCALPFFISKLYFMFWMSFDSNTAALPTDAGTLNKYKSGFGF